MKNDSDPVLALPCELGLAGPVAAQPDLDVARSRDVPVADEPVHRRSVRELDAEDLGPVSVCVSKWTRPTGPCRAETARTSPP